MTDVEAKTITETLERYLSQSKNRTDRDNITKAILAIGNLQIYQRIGDFYEFKTLKEKSVAKKPRFYAHNYYCTECGNLVGNNEFEWQRFLYCDKCGQKLDWQ